MGEAVIIAALNCIYFLLTTQKQLIFVSVEVLLISILFPDYFESQKYDWESTNNAQKRKIEQLEFRLQENFKEIEELKKEIQAQKKCKICYEDNICIVLLPCGHMCCSVCASKIQTCFMCRRMIDSRQKCFME